jgi:hypothetical protein
MTARRNTRQNEMANRICRLRTCQRIGFMPSACQLVCSRNFSHTRSKRAKYQLVCIPVQVLLRAAAIAFLQNTMLSLGAADLIWLAFFFLLHPGEYTITGTAPHPVTLVIVRLWCHDTPIDPLTASPDSLLSATFVILIFMDQKNAVHGETVGHGRSGDPQACPVLAIIHPFSISAHSMLHHTCHCALKATGGF